MKIIKSTSTNYLANQRLVGGKTVGLNFLQTLPKLQVPRFMVISTKVYESLISKNPNIHNLIADLQNESQQWIIKKIKQESNIEFSNQKIEEISSDLVKSFQKLSFSDKETKYLTKNLKSFFSSALDNCFACRSSATGEDSFQESFSGVYESVNEVKFEDIPSAVIKVMSSTFSQYAICARNEASTKQILIRAIKETINPKDITLDFVRKNFIFDHLNTLMAVIVQEWIQSTAAGTCFSINPKNMRSGTYVVAAQKGEEVVSGFDAKAEYFITKDNLDKTTKSDIISEENLRKLYEQSQLIFKKFSEKFNCSNVDTEFAIDSSGKLYWLQARPLIIGKLPNIKILSQIEPIYTGGVMASSGLATGNLKIGYALQTEDANKFRTNIKRGDIIAVDKFHANWADLVFQIGGVITELGESTSHVANICREKGIPCIVGAKNLFDSLQAFEGKEVTLFANEMKIFPGKVEYCFVSEDISDENVPTKKREVKIDKYDFVDENGRGYFGKPRFPLVGWQADCYINAMEKMNEFLEKHFNTEKIIYFVDKINDEKRIYAPADELKKVSQISLSSPLDLLSTYISKRKTTVKELLNFTRKMMINRKDLEKFFKLYTNAISFFHLRGSIMRGLLQRRIDLLEKYNISDKDYDEFCRFIFQPKTLAVDKLRRKYYLLQKIKKFDEIKSLVERNEDLLKDENEFNKKLVIEIFEKPKFRNLKSEILNFAKSYLIIPTEDIRVTEEELFKHVLRDLIINIKTEEELELAPIRSFSYNELENFLNKIPEKERLDFLKFSKILVEHNIILQENEHHLQPRIQWIFLDKLKPICKEKNLSLNDLLYLNTEGLLKIFD